MNFLKWNLICLLGGVFLDWLLGDPRWLPHPVRLMGSMIAGLEVFLRKCFPQRDRLAGTLLTAAMCLFWTLVPGLACLALWRLNPGGSLYLLAGSLMCFQLIAARDLCRESMAVAQALEKEDLELARQRVSMIVGRDTVMLDRQGIIRAAVETVAENASDGVIAPMLFIALFGPVGGYLYKAVNTMDSMIGYKNDRYRRFGTTAARLDDLLNLLPARLTGLLFCLTASLLPGFSGKNAWRIFLRDRLKHASPNSAHGEAACAGALQVELAGDAWYFGQLHRKPLIGDPIRPVQTGDIAAANRLMFGAELLFLLLWIGAGQIILQI